MQVKQLLTKSMLPHAINNINQDDSNAYKNYMLDLKVEITTY